MISVGHITRCLNVPNACSDLLFCRTKLRKLEEQAMCMIQGYSKV